MSHMQQQVTGAIERGEAAPIIEKRNRFDIGQRFTTRGKAPRECTVTDILYTYNAAGELVRVRYVATHAFLGQLVTDHDVCDATIARGLVP